MIHFGENWTIDSDTAFSLIESLISFLIFYPAFSSSFGSTAALFIGLSPMSVLRLEVFPMSNTGPIFMHGYYFSFIPLFEAK